MALGTMVRFRHNTKGQNKKETIDKPDFIEIKTSGFWKLVSGKWENRSQTKQ